MAEISDVFFVDGMRTPFGRAGEKGMYWNTRADDLAVKATIGLMERNPGVPADRIDDVALAATSQTGDQGLTLGRSVALLAGLPQTVPGFAIDRMCAGAMTSVTTMAGSIGIGMYDLALAGGVEHMGRHPLDGSNVDPNPAVRRGEARERRRAEHGPDRRAPARPLSGAHEGARGSIRDAEPAQGAGRLRQRQVPARSGLGRRQGRRRLVGPRDRGRRPPTRDDDGGARCAQDAVPPARAGHGGNLLPADRRRDHESARRRRCGEGAGSRSRR